MFENLGYYLFSDQKKEDEAASAKKDVVQLESELGFQRGTILHKPLYAEDDDEVCNEGGVDLLRGRHRGHSGDIAGEIIRQLGERDISEKEVGEGHGDDGDDGGERGTTGNGDVDSERALLKRKKEEESRGAVNLRRARVPASFLPRYGNFRCSACIFSPSRLAHPTIMCAGILSLALSLGLRQWASWNKVVNSQLIFVHIYRD